jgi:hypothetical protein
MVAGLTRIHTRYDRCAHTFFSAICIASTAPTHKFRVGAYVLHRIGMRSEKTSFRVTRQLPDGGAGLQYRIKGERDGIERVVKKQESIRRRRALS